MSARASRAHSVKPYFHSPTFIPEIQYSKVAISAGLHVVVVKKLITPLSLWRTRAHFNIVIIARVRKRRRRRPGSRITERARARAHGRRQRGVEEEKTGRLTCTLSVILLSLWMNSVVDLARSDSCWRFCDSSVWNRRDESTG